MLDNEPIDHTDNTGNAGNTGEARNTGSAPDSGAPVPAKKATRKAPAKRAPRKTAAQKATEAAAAENAPAAGASAADAPAPEAPATPVAEAPATDAKPKRAPRARKAPAKKAAASEAAQVEVPATATDAPAATDARADSAPTVGDTHADNAATDDVSQAEAPARKAPAKRTPRKRTSKAAAAAVPATDPAATDSAVPDAPTVDTASTPVDSTTAETTEPLTSAAGQPTLTAPSVLFQPPAEAKAPSRRRRGSAKAPAPEPVAPPADEPTSAADTDGTGDLAVDDLVPAEELGTEAVVESDIDADADTDADAESDAEAESDTDAEDSSETGGRRRRRRGRRGRGNRSTEDATDSTEVSDTEPTEPAELSVLAEDAVDEDEEEDHADAVAEAAMSASARRRRRRRRSTGADGAEAVSEDDPPNTVVHVRDSREGRGSSRGSAADDDGVRGVKGSTRLEAKRQRRRDNRDSGRGRAPILTEAEFLARREAVDRVMAVRQAGDRTQIAVLEDDILVEHYVTRASASSAVGNVYLGRVQNVLPSMEAAFIDIGRGRNGVLYAGEVNWDVAGLEGKARSIENALNPGDTVLVQVTKDPIGHKGARLTSQISLPGRFVVYVPGGGMTGISRKLPDVERSRLKAILKKVVPDEAGVIVRTAAEGATEEDLVSDVERLKTEWEAISKKAEKTKQSGDGPLIVHGEPDLAIRVVRDIFNDDFKKLVVSGSDIHRTLTDYVSDIAPELANRIALHTGESDLFRNLRVDEQLAKALDRKVWLPSGGSLVIDRTEAMTVVDVNTGKYTGSGGNLEQTVTRNNLEAAEEIVRQLRLRDIGGIVVIDFIDMVLESNRDLVLRRLTECLGRDRTKHQVAEVTSLGLVQMTRKRVGEGLLEAFSEPCEHCKGRGVILHLDPVEKNQQNGGTSAAPAAVSAGEERIGRGRRNRKARSEQTSLPEQPDQASLAAEEEKRRSAANAIAAIVAATNGHEAVVAMSDENSADRVDSDAASGDAVSGDALSSDEISSAVSSNAVGSSDATSGANGAAVNGRRSGRRRATSRGAVRPADEATDQPSGDAAAEASAVLVSEPAASQPASDSASREPAASDPVSSQPAAEPAPELVTGTATVPATVPPRPRRRRAASRPAGPPAGVTAAER